MPDNKYELTATAAAGTTRLSLSVLPAWFQIGCLIRIGTSETVGELQLIEDLVQPLQLDTSAPLVSTYTVDDTSDLVNYVSLLGTPGSFFEVNSGNFARKVMLIESWYQLVPGDSILASTTPSFLNSLTEYPLSVANLIGTRPGVPAEGEPATIYRYEIELANGSGLLGFQPTAGLAMYNKTQPCFYRGDYGSGDVKIDASTGPFLVDAFYGGLIYKQNVTTVLGIKTYDGFGNQVNAGLTGNQQWQQVPSNYLVLQRPITSSSLLLWQSIQGNFQLQETGYFQAELDSSGQFVMSSDQLVPRWGTDQANGWVIPIIAQSPITISVQFEPQDRQFYQVPSSTLFLIRPQIFADPNLVPISRIVIAIQGSPNSTVQILDWGYNGSTVNSLTYYILGTGAAFGQSRWIAGGFCIKPVFKNIGVLQANYSDGVSKYDSGYIYS